MGARLIIVSNRVAVPETPRAPLAGGMAVAVKAALKNRNGMWFGWSGKVAEQGEWRAARGRRQQDHLRPHRPVAERHPGILQRPRQQRAVADPPLPGRSAGVLARRRQRLHAGQSSVRRPPEQAAQGRRRHLGARLSPDAARTRAADRGVIEIRSDFSFILLARRRTSLQTLPHHREILGGLSHYNLVGFQTENDRDNFARYLATLGAIQVRGGCVRDRWPASASRRLSGQHRNESLHAPRAQRGAHGDDRAGAREPRRQHGSSSASIASTIRKAFQIG